MLFSTNRNCTQLLLDVLSMLSVGQDCCFNIALCVTICNGEISLSIPKFISEYLCIDGFTEYSTYIANMC